jgi:diacylglycerol kinase (ATP)
MKYKFIINENASTGKIKKAIPDLIELIKSSFEYFDYSVTNNLSQVPGIIKDSLDSDVIVAVGGDGTLNGILNNVIEHDKILGLIPLGTGNDFPIMLSIPKDLKKAIEILKNGKVKNIDIGHLQTEKYEKYFINAVGIGFDAKVGFHTNQIKFMDGGLSKYITSLFYSLLTYKTPEMNIEINHKEKLKKRCYLATIGNGRRTGGGFLLTPNALIDDGTFDVCIVDDVSFFTVLNAFPKVLKGKHTTLPIVKMSSCQYIEVNSDSELYLHYDGETPEMVKNIKVNILPLKQRIISNLI